jgi:uncharacterized membrane protein
MSEFRDDTRGIWIALGVILGLLIMFSVFGLFMDRAQSQHEKRMRQQQIQLEREANGEVR